MKIFEGHAPAMQEAEIQSRTNKTEVYVIKCNIGGLRYAVIDATKELPAESKVINHFKSGLALA